MTRLILPALAVFALTLTACGGGGTTIRIYKGTSTTTQTTGGGSGTLTTTGEYQLVSSSGTDPGKWLFSGGGFDIIATMSGTSLIFVGGTVISTTEGNNSSSLSLSNGTGNMTNEMLTLNLTLASMSTAQGNSSFTYVYNGTRE